MKRFNFLMQWLTIFLYVAIQPAVAGLPPTRSGGQSGSLSTTFDLRAPHNQVTKYSGTGGLIETGNNNIAKNPGFEATTYSSNWATTGGTLAAATTTNIFYSKGATWNSNAAAQEFSSDLATLPEGFVGNNCEASIYVKVPSGTATHTFRAVDNSSNVLASMTIVNSTYFRHQTVNFPCPASGTSVALQLISVASDEPLIAVDEAYLGLARNVGSTQLITEWESCAFTNSFTGGSNSTTALCRRVGTNMEAKVSTTFTSVFTGGTATYTLPAAQNCTIDTAKIPNSGSGTPVIGAAELRDIGTDQHVAMVTVSTSSSVLLRASQDDTGPASTSIVYSAITTTVPFTWANNDIISFEFSVPCVGWAAQTLVMPDAQGWFVDAIIAGANPSLGVANVSAYTEITNASLTMVPRTGSAPVGVMCSGTNAATAPSTGSTTCAAGSESLGATFNVPTSGTHRVCAYFSHNLAVDTSEGINTAFQLIQTPTNAQTETAQGGTRILSAFTAGSATSTNQSATFPHANCSNFQFSAGQVGVRLMYEQAVSGTPNSSQILADQDGSTGQRDFHITVERVSSQQQALLANSVSTPIANGEKMGSAQINCDAASAINRNRQSMVSSVGNISAGLCNVTLASGYFSGTPDCVASWNASGANQIDFVTCSSSTACIIGANTDAGAAATAADINMICIGPR